MASFPRTILPHEVTSLEMPGPLIVKAQSGRVNLRSTQQVGRSWTERFLINVRSIDGRALLAAVDDYWRNGTIFTISHVDHLTPLGTGGGSPLINQPTQLVTDPENFGAWAVVGTPVRTGGQTDPFGGTSAYLVDDNDGAAFEYLVSTGDIAFTDGTRAFSIFVKQGTLANCWFRMAGGAVERHRVRVTWTAGVPSLSTQVGAGTLFTVENWGGGWWRVSASANGVLAADTNTFQFGPGSDGAASDTGTGYFFGANAWNAATPAGYIGPSHLAATGTRLYVDSATASVTNWLRAGDIVSVAALGPVYEVTATVNSEAGGYASIPVNPPIFTGGAPSDNAVVTITGVTLSACLLEPPTFPTTSGRGNDYGELVCKFSESL